MKKVYLTDQVPETLHGKSVPADIRQKVEAYRINKEENLNEAPHVRPYPLEKYETQKTKETVDAGELSGKVTNEASNLGSASHYKSASDAVDKLPHYMRARARRILPYVLNTNYGEVDLSALLYDLLKKNSKKLKTGNEEIVQSVIAQLNDNPLIPKTAYVQRVGTEREDEGVLSTPMHTPHPSRGPPKHLLRETPHQYIRRSAPSKFTRWD